MLDEDLDSFLQDHGLPCSCGVVGFLGIKDEPDEQINVGQMNAQSTMTTLLIKSVVVAAAGIRAGSAITVDGVAYIARVPVRLDDGAFTHVPLTKGPP